MSILAHGLRPRIWMYENQSPPLVLMDGWGDFGRYPWKWVPISWLWIGSGPMVRHYCHGSPIPHIPLPVFSSFLIIKTYYLPLSTVDNKQREVWKLGNHANNVRPWVHCLDKDYRWLVLKHSQGGFWHGRCACVSTMLSDDTSHLCIQCIHAEYLYL